MAFTSFKSKYSVVTPKYLELRHGMITGRRQPGRSETYNMAVVTKMLPVDQLMCGLWCTFNHTSTQTELWMCCMELLTGPRPHGWRLLLLWPEILITPTWGKSCQDITSTSAMHGENKINHVYTPFQDGYETLPQPPFGKSDHISVLLLPSYGQNLKQDRPVTWTIPRWSDQSDSALHHCFSVTKWCVFLDDNIDTYTDVVIVGYISKCINDVVPRITVRKFPNQKPWVNGEVHTKLKGRTNAYSSGDLEEYRKSRYALWRAIAVLRDNTGMKWSLTTRAPTLETCGLD